MLIIYFSSFASKTSPPPPDLDLGLFCFCLALFCNFGECKRSAGWPFTPNEASVQNYDFQEEFVGWLPTREHSFWHTIFSLKFGDLDDKENGCSPQRSASPPAEAARSQPCLRSWSWRGGGHSPGGHWSATIPKAAWLREGLVTVYSHFCNSLKHIMKLHSLGSLFLLRLWLQMYLRQVQQELFRCSPERVRSGCTFCRCQVKFWRWPRTSGAQLPDNARQGEWGELGYFASRMGGWWHGHKTCW